MRKLLTTALALILALTPGVVYAQDTEGDMQACEQLLSEAADQIDELHQRTMDAEAAKVKAETALDNRKKGGPYKTPMRGALQSIPFYAKQPAYIQIGVAGLIDLLILTGAAYLEVSK